jgi:uncharacterized membrane protein YkvA (DUF1232 family)
LAANAPATLTSLPLSWSGHAYAAAMLWWTWLAVGLGVALAVWAACVALLVVFGRRSEARALARFIPDCLVLFRRLLSDGRVPRSRKLVLVALVGYLALPFDLVPDFIPVAGQLDDAILIALGLRFVLRAAGPELLREHWPGPADSLAALMRLAFAGR